jgi:hypothetical protein
MLRPMAQGPVTKKLGQKMGIMFVQNNNHRFVLIKHECHAFQIHINHV